MIDDSTLWATDALLDSLALGELPAEDDDRGLQLLSALVLDVSADLPTTSGTRLLRDEVRARRSHLRRLAPRTGVALAAAVAVVSTSGVAAASVNAGPTSALFPLHQVLTGQPQLDGSQRQALEVRDKLKSATRALAAGKVDRAQRDVSAAAKRISKVAEADGRRALAAQWVVVNRQVKAHAVAPVAPVKPTQTVLPAPTHSPSLTPKPAVSPAPTVSPTPTTALPHPAPTTTPVPTSVLPTTPVPVPVVPTSPQPSDTGTGSPQPSDTGSATPSGTGTPAPTDSPTPGTHHGKGGKPSTPPPSAAAGSPIDPIVITPAPTDSAAPPTQSPGDQTAPMPSDDPADATSAPAPSAPAPSAAVVVPPSAVPLP